MVTTEKETIWLTAGEVARLLGVSVKTVHRWAKSGKIRAVTLPSGRRRYDKATIDALIASANK
jgi:excisionase family DNA binding protein